MICISLTEDLKSWSLCAPVDTTQNAYNSIIYIFSSYSESDQKQTFGKERGHWATVAQTVFYDWITYLSYQQLVVPQMKALL